MFDSIAAFLKTASQRQPLVLVLDDLHWADQPSLMLLQFVARELGGARLLIIGTYRDMELSRQHPLAETLGELTRERLFQRVLLRGLTQEDVGRFIEIAAGVTPPSALVNSVYTQTEGNPLFVTEVVRLLVQEGELSAEKVQETDSWTIRIPEGVREVIGRRLNRLSQRCNEALTVASILGREFTIAQLRPLVEEVTEDQLFEVLEEALAARVIEELPQSVGRYQFTHALIQETLTAELSLTRRVRLHARIAQALEDLYGDDAESHAAELAHHFAQAEAMTGADKLVRYSLLAGERALGIYAHEDAFEYFQRALAARNIPATGAKSAHDAETAALLFGLGRAQAATLPRFQGSEAIATLTRAFDYYADVGDVDRAVAAAEAPIGTTPGLKGLARLQSRALELVAPGSPAAGRLLPLYGRALGVEEGDYEAAQQAWNQALEIAQRTNDPSLEMWTLAWAGGVAGLHLYSEVALKNGLHVIQLANRLGDLAAEAMGHEWASRALLETGQPREAELHAKSFLELTTRLRHRSQLDNATGWNTIVTYVQGDWRETRNSSDRGLEMTPGDPRHLSIRALLENQQGDFAQGQNYLDQLLDSLGEAGPHIQEWANSYVVELIAQVARITGSIEWCNYAEQIANEVTSVSSPIPRYVRMTTIGLGLIAVLRSDTESAKEHYALLGLEPTIRIDFESGLAMDRMLGLLAQTMGNLDQASTHFEDALTFCRKAGYRPELAWTCCDYADALRERNGEGDRAKAVSRLDESLAISSELGMRPLMERVLARREFLGA